MMEIRTADEARQTSDPLSNDWGAPLLVVDFHPSLKAEDSILD
jgi:hypothetical protein